MPEHALVHKQLTTLYAENGVMLGVHPAAFNAMEGTKARLPISMYESTTESEQPAAEGAMQVDGSEAAHLRFRPVPFAIETDETEMIAINYVAKGAGSAAALSQAPQAASKKAEDMKEASGKTKAKEEKETPQPKGPVLTPEEEDQIAGLTTRLNAVKMLNERLQLMSKLVQSTPPSYLSDQTVPISATSPPSEHLVQLRNIQALLTRLSLLTPSDQLESEDLQQASRAQANDVALTSILSMLGQDIQGLSELGRKFVTVEQTKSVRNKSKGGFGQSSFDDYNGRPGGMGDAGMLMM